MPTLAHLGVSSFEGSPAFGEFKGKPKANQFFGGVPLKKSYPLVTTHAAGLPFAPSKSTKRLDLADRARWVCPPVAVIGGYPLCLGSKSVLFGCFGPKIDGFRFLAYLVV